TEDRRLLAFSLNPWSNTKNAQSWGKGQVVADVGRNPLRGGCAAARVAVRLGLVCSAEIACLCAECRKSHVGWDGENARCDRACRLASGTGETGGDSQSGLSADQYRSISLGVGWRASAGQPKRGWG